VWFITICKTDVPKPPFSSGRRKNFRADRADGGSTSQRIFQFWLGEGNPLQKGISQKNGSAMALRYARRHSFDGGAVLLRGETIVGPRCGCLATCATTPGKTASAGRIGARVAGAGTRKNVFRRGAIFCGRRFYLPADGADGGSTSTADERIFEDLDKPFWDISFADSNIERGLFKCLIDLLMLRFRISCFEL